MSRPCFELRYRTRCGVWSNYAGVHGLRNLKRYITNLKNAGCTNIDYRLVNDLNRSLDLSVSFHNA